MAVISFNFTTQYPGTYYALVHDQKNAFYNKTTRLVSVDITILNNFVISLTKDKLNSYVASITSDSLESGVYTFRIYKQNGSSPDIAKDDLISVGQTGWNKTLNIQENPNDIIRSIQAYEDRQDSIWRIDILLDSVQLGLRNGETGFARLDLDQISSSLKVKAFWNLQANVSATFLSIRGPASLGQRTSQLLSWPLRQGTKEFTITSNLPSDVKQMLLSKAFYVTIETAGFPFGRVGGYPIYTPSSPVGASGTVSFSVQPGNLSTGVSFRTV